MTNATMPEPVAWSVLDKRTGKHWYTHESKLTAQAYASHYAHQERDGSRSMIAQPLITTDQAEAYAAAKVREALKLAAATVAKGINERSSLISNVTRRNAANEILNLIQ